MAQKLTVLYSQDWTTATCFCMVPQSLWCRSCSAYRSNVARTVVKADRRCDAGPLRRQLHWLPIGCPSKFDGFMTSSPTESRLRFKIVLLTYKVRSTSTPSYLSSIITPKRPTGYSLCSSSAPQLTIPRVKTKFAGRAFCVAYPPSSE